MRTLNQDEINAVSAGAASASNPVTGLLGLFAAPFLALFATFRLGAPGNSTKYNDALTLILGGIFGPK